MKTLVRPLTHLDDDKNDDCSFILDTLVCMSNGIYDKFVCYAIFRKSCGVLNLDGKTFKQFEQILDEVNTDNAERAPQKITTYAEYIVSNVKTLGQMWQKYFPYHRQVIENSVTRLEEKIHNDNIASWPITDAAYVWQWLHIVAIDIDLNCGMEEKQAFFKFIPEIIACGVCKKHYSQHLNGLINSLEKTTAANTLLALHSYINENITNINNSHDDDTTIGFVYDKRMVNLFFANKYKKYYINLKTNYEL